MHRTGSAVMSGALNGTRAFVLEATAAAAVSQYPAIVSLVQQAAESRAPWCAWPNATPCRSPPSPT